MANKTVKEIYYETAPINNFLESLGFPYCASCFRAQYGPVETITSLELEKFIRYYFVESNNAQLVYRKIQAGVTGYIDFK
jgi:hypothetical protein